MQCPRCWGLLSKPTYGCEVKSDGLHVYVKDTDRFYYCTSGHGAFADFAFQVDMRILSGAGGGMVFRANDSAGNYYYFHVYPDGLFHIYIVQNRKLSSEIGDGSISTFNSGFGRKNTLTVIAQGSLLLFYMNQQFIYRAQDTTYNSGYLGVLAEDYTSPGETVYTNAQIWRL